jgi:hypothetical protein
MKKYKDIMFWYSNITVSVIISMCVRELTRWMLNTYFFYEYREY